MRFYIKPLIFSSFGLFLTSCSHTPPDQTRFVQYAQTLPPLTVPADIKNPTAQSYYPVPPVTITAPWGVKPPLAPPGSQLVANRNVSLPAPQ